jgi:hypothetical protein
MNERPTYNVSIDNSYFVEALTSSKSPVSYLDNFPEELYNTSADSRLYKFLYALIGPAGTGSLKTNYFYARLQLEEHGIVFDQLDKLYGNPFRFARNFDESYTENWKSLLTKDQFDSLKASDESYRTRVIDYFHAARLGGTPQGMYFAAKSATGYDVRIVENYLPLFNEHSDTISHYNINPQADDNGFYNVNQFIVVPNDTANNEINAISDQEAKLLDDAISILKPANVVYSTDLGQSDRDAIETKSVFASSEFHQVVRFATGSPTIPWPNVDQTNNNYWIESGVEKEAPRSVDDFQQHYQFFYQPNNITASTFKFGQFNSYFVAKFPELKAATNQDIWSADNALASYPNSLTVTRQNNSTATNIINYEYSAEYLNLPNVPTLKYNSKFWASAENLDQTTEFLEIDLGSTQAINFLIFELLSTPLDIEIQYDANDVIDGSSKNPIKIYKDVTFDPLYPADTQIQYDANSLNKWNILPYVFTDENGEMIFTRFIKIGFTRNASRYYNQSTFLVDSNQVAQGWSVIVKNLRAGRNVS